MATLEQIDEKLDRVGNSLTEVKTVLLGKNGDKGLVGQVEAHERDLDKIKGIGPRTKEILLKNFGSVDKIRNASQTDLEKLVGFSKSFILSEYFKN